MLEKVREWIWERRWQSLAAFLFLSAIGSAFLIGASESVRQCEQAENQANRHQGVPVTSGLHAVSGHCDWVFLGENDKQMIVLATLGLFAVTAGLTVYTARLWGATKGLAAGAKADSAAQVQQTQSVISEAARSANAMEATTKEMKRWADAAVLSERGFVLLDATTTRKENNGLILGPLQFKLIFCNYGRTPVRVDSLKTKGGFWTLAELEALTELPRDSESHKMMGIYLAAYATMGERRVHVQSSPEQTTKATADDGALAVLGQLVYTDTFGIAQEMGFALRLVQGGTIFEWANSHLNYSRPVKGHP